MGVPVEGDVGDAHVAVVGTGDGVHDEGAVFGIAAEGAKAVLRPGERHDAVAADAAEGRAQGGGSAARGGMQDGAAGLGADGEGAEARSCGGRRPGGGAVGAFLVAPGVARLAAPPLVAAGEFPGGQLGKEHSPGVAEHLDDGGLLVQVLVFEGARAPGDAVALDVDDVLCSPRDAVERAFVVAGGDLGVGGFGLREGEVVEPGDDAVDLRVVLM